MYAARPLRTFFHPSQQEYRQTSNISRTLVDNKIVDHSDVGAAPTTSSFSI